VGELDGVRVAQLVPGKSATDTRGRGGVTQLGASGRDRPAPTARRAGDDAEQQPHRKCERLTDPQAGAPQDDDQAAQALPVTRLALGPSCRTTVESRCRLRRGSNGLERT
jgi:hypothetical protein